ncbi:hypothetical protein EMIHUDRAFT_416679 [Emiliania huxleyi CCMP1516]|uniref:Autophagy-related protein n=2 Tax=Emiliania huxleyi TaxID=2903 RepID=A0A0D3IFC9_EMIH1|nr:hypothetical protein EMIHUDRAFT_416679 [Emiliania huxleyi CCMP1516]EOD09964.1 hypothetical protein EMIHUDRAFT_416679 [Emiliania huxleyi CCMP1516]|eukprot:XP_005762393.1 hypothetical protein EMIHUDRAFT_416679 [Emiliania huxleyi CCMP1516]
MSYRDAHSFESRRTQALAIRAKHPDRIPVIVEKRPRDATLPLIDKKKFLVPADLTVGQFVYVIRKRIALKPEQAIFLFVSKGAWHARCSWRRRTLPPTVATCQAVYDSHKDEDGFLYMTYSGENTFGTV